MFFRILSFFKKKKKDTRTWKEIVLSVDPPPHTDKAMVAGMWKDLMKRDWL